MTTARPPAARRAARDGRRARLRSSASHRPIRTGPSWCVRAPACGSSCREPAVEPRRRPRPPRDLRSKVTGSQRSRRLAGVTRDPLRRWKPRHVAVPDDPRRRVPRGDRAQALHESRRANRNPRLGGNLGGDELRACDPGQAQRDVSLAPDEVARQGRCVDLDVHPRVLRTEPGKRRDHEGLGHPRVDREAHGPFSARLHARGVARQAGVRGLHPLRRLEDLLGRSGANQPVTAALEESDAKVLLECSDSSADGRGVDAEARGRHPE